MAIVASSLSPVGEGVSVGRYVSKAIGVLREQERVRFEVGPMFTTLEGDMREVFEVIRKMQAAMFDGGAERVSTVIKVDERRDKLVTMEEKLASVL